MRWWTSHAPLLLQTTSSQPVQLMHLLTATQEQVDTITTQTVCQLYESVFTLYNYFRYFTHMNHSLYYADGISDASVDVLNLYIL